MRQSIWSSTTGMAAPAHRCQHMAFNAATGEVTIIPPVALLQIWDDRQRMAHGRRQVVRAPAGRIHVQSFPYNTRADVESGLTRSTTS